MTLAAALERAWRTLEAGPAPENLVRSLSDLGVPGERMKLAVEEGRREILFPARPGFVLEEGQGARGMKLLHRVEGRPGSADAYLVLRCTDEDFHGVFRRFAAAVLEQVAAAPDPATAALQCIKTWAGMFERAGRKSKTALLGIYGELHELAVLAKYGAGALASWVGPDDRPQDFVRGRLALEVKTHEAQVPSTEIHGLEQLWLGPFDTLVLVVKQVALDPGGELLTDAIARAEAAGVSGSDLRQRMEALDLDTERLASLDARYSHRGSRYFRVTSAAPSLTPDSLVAPLHPGVAAVRYRVALNSPGFERMAPSEVESLLRRIGSGGGPS
jgi:hypothetical protein